MKRKFTNFTILLLAMGMILSLTACGGKDDGKESEPSAPSTEQIEPQSTEKPQPEPLPISANLEDYKVTILSAEEFDTDEGGKGIRFYYDFTNNSGESINAGLALFDYATQDGKDLEDAYADYDSSVPEEYNYRRLIRPGVTIRCVEQYAYDPKGGPVAYALEKTLSDEVVRVELKPEQLTGRPTEDFVISPIADPVWTKGLAVEGIHRDKYHVQIDCMELINNKTAARVYFSFTNNSDETIVPYIKTKVDVYQDGVELLRTFPDEKITEDEAYAEELEPGGMVTVSECYELLSTSPIEVGFMEQDGSYHIGAVFPFE